MDEVWLEVLDSSEENLAESSSVEGNLADNSSGEENWAKENNSSEKEHLIEENGAVEAKWAKKYSSAEENWAKDYSLLEETRPKEYSSMEENGPKEYSSMEENGPKEYSSMEENGPKEYSSMEENGPKEYRSMEENGPKECSSMEENWAKNMSSAEENWAKESSSTEENWIEKFSSAKENSSIEENLSEEDELMDENFIEEHGLVFEAAIVNKEVCVVEIVTVGNCDCGKTQLIESFFGDHPTFEVTNLKGRNEYSIYLSKNMFVYILIYDVKEEEYARKENFLKKTVAFFCYDMDDFETLVNLEETWIPIIKRMPCFLVGIQRDPKTKPNAVNGIKSGEQKMAVEKKAKELCHQLRNGRHIICSTEEKSSMLKVFQSAIDTVYPLTSLG